MVLGRNAYPEVRNERMSRIRQPHVAPINALADEIARARALEPGTVPYVDPDQGGIHARALVLLDNPSTMAEAGTGSGLLSLDNNDATARNCREAYDRHGVSWKNVVHWNVCPFPTSNTKNGGSHVWELKAGVVWTRRLVDLLPDLTIVLPLGKNARTGWQLSNIARPDLYDFTTREIPHCGNRGLNSKPGARKAFDDAIRDLSIMLGTPAGQRD
ncbi:uracil-DNA glycosylase [Nocardia sp. NPDC056000]|uniref:uracil-DNA glycosylase n=1 Tax=Nocardia sp. NPDC056000 TaxID=3345674 RepID=UPI0035DAFA6B